MLKLKNEIKQFLVWLSLFGAMPFLSFHVFLFSICYYRSALEVPLVLVLPLVWICCLRAMSYAPIMSGASERMLRTPFARKNPLSLMAVFEAAGWYAIIAAGYAMLHRWFGFPKSTESFGVLSPVGGYLAFFVGSFLGMTLVLLVTRGLRGVWQQLVAMRLLTLRLLSTFVVYLVVMLQFAGLYRLISLHTPSAFSSPLRSTMDAIYFSTVTITTLGYGDISPISQWARALATAEALAGIFLIAILIGLVISFSIEEAKEHNKSDARDGL